MDYSAELKRRIAKIDKPEEQAKVKERAKQFVQNNVQSVQELYDIWQLSLPIGVIQKPVMFGLTEKEAEKFIFDLRNTRTKNLSDDQKVIVFFEKFRQGDSPDPLKNYGPITKDVDNEEVTIEHGYDVEWQG